MDEPIGGSGAVDYQIEPDGRHTLVIQRTKYLPDLSAPEYDDPERRRVVEFLSHVGLVQAASLSEEMRSSMGFGLSSAEFKAMAKLINTELESVPYSEAQVVIDDRPTPATATTYRGRDFLFPFSWPPAETSFTIHRAAEKVLVTGWPTVTSTRTA